MNIINKTNNSNKKGTGVIFPVPHNTYTRLALLPSMVFEDLQKPKGVGGSYNIIYPYSNSN